MADRQDAADSSGPGLSPTSKADLPLLLALAFCIGCWSLLGAIVALIALVTGNASTSIDPERVFISASVIVGVVAPTLYGVCCRRKWTCGMAVLACIVFLGWKALGWITGNGPLGFFVSAPVCLWVLFMLPSPGWRAYFGLSRRRSRWRPVLGLGCVVAAWASLGCILSAAWAVKKDTDLDWREWRARCQPHSELNRSARRIKEKRFGHAPLPQDKEEVEALIEQLLSGLPEEEAQLGRLGFLVFDRERSFWNGIEDGGWVELSLLDPLAYMSADATYWLRESLTAVEDGNATGWQLSGAWQYILDGQREATPIYYLGRALAPSR